MPKISDHTLVLAVQAIDTEIWRLLSLPEEVIVPGDQELLVQYQTAAEELEEAYAETAARVVNLPPYATLVRQSD